MADGVDRAEVRITVRDRAGQPLAGRRVVIRSNGRDDVLFQPEERTGPDGTVLAGIASTRAEPKTITAVVDPGSKPVLLEDRVIIGFEASEATISAALSNVELSKAEGLVADGRETVVITATVLDAFANPVPGQIVVITSSGTDNTIEGPAAATDASGRASATLASLAAEDKNLTITINPGPGQVVLDARPKITFVGDRNNVSAALSTIEIDPLGDIVADGSALARIVIVVRDVNENPVRGLPVQVLSTGSGNTIVQPESPTGPDGAATATLASLRAEDKTIAAFVDPLDLGIELDAHPVVPFVADAANPSPTRSTLTAGAPGPFVANGLDGTALTVTVVDPNGNPIEGLEVAFAATGAGNVLTQPGGPTDAAGQASAHLASTVAGSKQVTVVLDPAGSALPVNASATLSFLAGGVSVANSTVTALPATPLVANGVDTFSLAVTLRDAFGNPIQGTTVQLAASGGGNLLNQPVGPSDAQGLAVGSLASTLAETKTISAIADPGGAAFALTAMPTVTFVADTLGVSASLSSVLVDPAVGTVADGLDTAHVTFVVRDAAGQPVPGQTVSFRTSGSPGDVLVQPLGPTDASGLATGTIAATVAETKTIIATVDPGATALDLAEQPLVTFVGDASNLSAALSGLAVAPASVVADGVDAATLTVTARDANGNPVPSISVLFQSSGSKNTVTQRGATALDGTTTGTLRSTRAETKTVTAVLDPGGQNLVVASQPTVTFLADAQNLSPSLSTVVAAPTTLVADGAAATTLTVRVVDVNNNVVPGVVAQLFVDGAGNVLTQPGATGALGTSSGSLSSIRAEEKTVTGVLDPAGLALPLAQPALVLFQADADNPDGTLSALVADPASGVVADGLDASLVTVMVVDANSNPIPGLAVQVSSDEPSDVVTPLAATTDASGSFRAEVTATAAGTRTISAVIDPGGAAVPVVATAALEFEPGAVSPLVSTIAASPTSLVADGIELATLTITLRDANGNAVPGVLVEVDASGTDNTLSQPTGPTDAFGRTTATLASTRAETKVVTAVADPAGTPIALANPAEVVFTADPEAISPTLSTLTAVPLVDVVADGSTASQVTVTVLDENGNPVPGQEVELFSDGTTASFVQPALTDANGQTTGSITSLTAEVVEIGATVNPNTSAVVLGARVAVTFVADPTNIDAGASTVTVTPGTVVANGLDLATITVTVFDINANPIPNVTVALSASGTNNVLAPPSGTTNAAGQLSATLASLRAEPKTISATVDNGVTPTVQLAQMPVVTFIGDVSNPSAALSSVTALPTAGLLANGIDTTTVSIRVVDVNGNVLPGRTVDLAATGSENLVVQPAVTGSSGQATGTLATTRAETKTLSVVVDPLGVAVALDDMPVVTFAADAGNISPTLSSVDLAPRIVVADGVAAATISVTVIDVNGNPVPGVTLGIDSSDPADVIAPPAGPTDAAGFATGSIRSLVAGTKTVTVTADPAGAAVVLPSVQLEFLADADNVSTTLSTVVAAPDTDLVANGIEVSTITVTVVDVNANPIPGLVVELSSTGTANTLTRPAGPTDANGQVTATLASVRAETKVVSAVVDPLGHAVALAATPAVTFLADAANPSPTLSALVMTPPGTVVANGVDVATLTMTVRDVNANPIPGLTVAFSSTGAGTISTPAPTNAAGNATATIHSTVAEANRITGVIDPLGANVTVLDQPVVLFIADADNPSIALSTVGAAPLSGIVANGVAITTIAVTVRDTFGNPIPGRPLSIGVTGTSNMLSAAPDTDAGGSSSATLSSTRAEAKTVTVVYDPSGIALALGSVVVEFVADPTTISAAGSSVSAVPLDGILANGVDTSTISIVVVDAFGNPVPGQNVNVEATGSNNSILQPPAPTDGLGRASATLSSRSAEAKLVTVTVNPAGAALVLLDRPTITFVADPDNISATKSSVVASPDQNVVADGLAASVVTVTVIDSNDNPVPGRLVQLAVSGTNNTVSPLAPTDANGVTSASLTSLTAELKTITAVVDPGVSSILLADAPMVQFVADAANPSATLSSVSAAPASGVVANGVNASTITTVVRDANGNPIPGIAVAVSATGTGNTLVPASGTTAGDGTFVATLSSTTAETKLVTVVADPAGAAVLLAAQPTVDFVADTSNISATLSTVTATPTTGLIADGIESSTLDIQVVDANQNPLPGLPVAIFIGGSQNTLTPPGPYVTDATGRVTALLSSTKSEAKTVFVTADPGGAAIALAAQPVVVFLADSDNISPTLSTVVANPATGVVANGVVASTITVTVVDVNANPVPGQNVLVTASGAGNNLTTASPTNANGVTTVRLTSIVAEPKTVTAVADPLGALIVLSTTPTVEFIADAENISPSLSSLVATPSTGVIADGVDTSTLTVVVRDVNGNVVPGALVQLDVIGTNNTIVQPPPTDAAGMSFGTLASTVAEAKLVRATVDPAGNATLLAAAPTVDFIADVANISVALSLVQASPAIDVVADGATLSTVTVTVLDANQNPVPGQVVELAATGAGNLLVQPSAPTNALGRAIGTLASTVAETKTVSAVVNPGGNSLVLLQQPEVGFVADAANPSAALSNVSADPAKNLIADGAELSTITANVVDPNGNPIAGIEIELSITGLGNTVDIPSSVTDALGNFTATLATTVAETKDVRITVDPSGVAVLLATQPTIEFLADADNISPALSSATISPGAGIPANGLEEAVLTVIVRDVNGNAVPGQNVSFTSPVAGDFLQQPGTTDAGGSASGTIATIEPGARTLNVVVNPFSAPLPLADAPGVVFDEAPLVLYVRTSGSDADRGVLPERAFRTIGHALALAGPTDEIVIGGGTYPGNVLLSSAGLSGAPIRLSGDRDGSRTGDVGPVSFDAGFGPYALRVQAAAHWEITGLDLTGSPFGGFGLVATAQSDGLVLADCNVYGNQTGVRIESSSDVRIEDCRISRNGGRNLSLDDCPDAVIFNNLVYAAGSFGLDVSGAQSVGVAITSNTFYANQGDQIRVDDGAALVRVRDNIVAFGQAGGIVRTASGSILSSFNDAFANFGGDWSGLGPGTGDLSLDPAFVDPDGADDVLGGSGADDDLFLVAPASPTLDAGSTLASSVLFRDGTSQADRTTRSDGVFDGTPPDAPTLNQGHHRDAPVGLLFANDLDADGRPDVVFALPEGPAGDELGFEVGVRFQSGGELLFSATADDAGFGATTLVADLDGDGLEDLAVGAPRAGRSSVLGATGRVYVFLGPLAPGRRSAASAEHVFVGEETGEAFGSALLALAGGDAARARLLVGAPGRAAGRGAVDRFELGAPTRVTLLAPEPGEAFGTSLGQTGEYWIVGAPQADGGRGAVHVYAGLETESDATGVRLSGNRSEARFGRVLTVGALGGPDGTYLLVADETASVHAFHALRLASLDGHDATAADFTISGQLGFAERLVTADLDGDGYDELVTSGADVRLFRGGPDVRIFSASGADLVLPSTHALLGDTNADGRLDLGTTSPGEALRWRLSPGLSAASAAR